MASLNPDLELQAYVIGLAIGDGNLSNPNGRAVRLRISCDTIYPALLEKIAFSLHTLLPDNKVSLIRRKARCMDVSFYGDEPRLPTPPVLLDAERSWYWQKNITYD